MTIIKNKSDNIWNVTENDFKINWKEKIITFYNNRGNKDCLVSHFKNARFYFSENENCHVLEIEF